MGPGTIATNAVLLAILLNGKPATRRPNTQRKGPLHIQKGNQMSKGNNKRGNKEAKKPKQVKPKVSATAVSNAGKAPIVMAGKKIK